MRPWIGALLLIACCSRPYDTSFDTSVAAPAYTRNAPRILVDEGHHNRHTVSGTYKPFAKLLENDGCSLTTLRREITHESLADAQVLVIPSAMGKGDDNASPAFSAAEVEAIASWVEGGGSLLIVTDHFPFGEAVRNLAGRFGVECSGGMTLDPVNYDRATTDDSRLDFSRSNGLLASHPITEGRNASERINRVLTFTGQSLRASRGTTLLRLGQSAVNRVATPHVIRSGGDTKVEVTFGSPTSAEGWAQAVAVEQGKGRVVILGEAAMITAQMDGGRPIGMNVPGVDNRQFLLNTIHWLAPPAGR